MSRNIYDDAGFFAGYSQLPRSREGLSGAPEWPAVKAMLPDLAGADVLDLGCGFGAFDRWAVQRGARRVVGVDLSENMLARARALCDSDRIDYRRGDLSMLVLDERRFDLIYSALAFHYVADFAALCRKMRLWLADGGRLVASVEHPLYTAPRNPVWTADAEGHPVWPLNAYLEEGERVTRWFIEGVVKYHRTIASYLRSLWSAGFRLLDLVEWGPDTEQIAAHPEWARERDRPMFLLFSAEAVAP